MRYLSTSAVNTDGGEYRVVGALDLPVMYGFAERRCGGAGGIMLAGEIGREALDNAMGCQMAMLLAIPW